MGFLQGLWLLGAQSATRTQDNRTAAGGAWYKLTRAGGMGFLQGLWMLGAQSATRTQDNRTVAGGAWYKLTRAKGMGFLQGLCMLGALSASYRKGGEPRRREGAADENS